MRLQLLVTYFIYCIASLSEVVRLISAKAYTVNVSLLCWVETSPYFRLEPFMFLALAFIMSLFRLRSLTPTSSASCRFVLLDYKGRIVVLNIHHSLMCLFLYLVNYSIIGPLPLGEIFLQLHYCCYGIENKVLINVYFMQSFM